MSLKRFPAAIGATTFFVLCVRFSACLAQPFSHCPSVAFTLGISTPYRFMVVNVPTRPAHRIFSSSALILNFKLSWIKNSINFVVYEAALIYMHYQREHAERRLYTLRETLKQQFKATQKAQVNERKAADSKRRLTSYVFHEVRVPLNTALLAVQNMEASGMITKRLEIEFTALEGSLSMMSKVLNDVLDFNRMDSGKFESVHRPYLFHQVMLSMFIPLRLAAEARQLEFITDLDPNIDMVARRAMYEAMGKSETEVEQLLEEESQSASASWGTVVGDETRLRQIITNLASNACKFTPAGGKLRISTKLIWPPPPSGPLASTPVKEERFAHAAESRHSLTLDRAETGDRPISQPSPPRNGSLAASQHLDDLRPRSADHAYTMRKHMDEAYKPLDRVVVRIEVSDTGWGIHRRDLTEAKLFSAFNQTEQGRQQGGKGTGLGLALVRQIVTLSGGRLGVKSKVNEGSTFWVELPLGVGARALDTPISPLPRSVVPALRVEGLPLGSMALNDAGAAVPRSSSAGTHDQDAAVRRSLQLAAVPAHPVSSVLDNIVDQGDRGNLASFNALPQLEAGEASGRAGPHMEISLPSSQLQSLGHPPSSFPPEAATGPTTSKLVERTIAAETVKILHETASFSAESSSFQPIPQGAKPSLADDDGLRGCGLRVLVVDDDALTRKLMHRMLTRIGCDVSTADNGEVAVGMILESDIAVKADGGEDEGVVPQQAKMNLATDISPAAASSSSGSREVPRRWRYDVVFMDNQMPVMSGLDAVRKLRRLGRTDFVVGVTGNALLGDQNEYLAAGVDKVLTKPVLERSLRQMLLLAQARRKPHVELEQPP
ncbi:hypothetical protein HGRIS_005174 [Hohenbuehelia grisea]|uniref:histidine kinase n=1 Tax=Hohenbuehelia grisea TaxID=104357 RepID=A0ABR3JE62_9AGAR